MTSDHPTTKLGDIVPPDQLAMIDRNVTIARNGITFMTASYATLLERAGDADAALILLTENILTAPDNTIERYALTLAYAIKLLHEAQEAGA